MSAGVILAAAGAGKRLKGNVEKQFLKLGRRTILELSLSIFERHPEVAAIVVVLPLHRIAGLGPRLRRSFKKISAVVAGGKERFHSVDNGFRGFSKPPAVILIHDAVRPLASGADISALIRALKQCDAATLAVPVKDTIKVVRGNRILKTPDRSALWHTQTPQGFRRAVLEKALGFARRNKITGTDECLLAERLRYNVRVVMGSYRNIKITTPEDLRVARALF